MKVFLCLFLIACAFWKGYAQEVSGADHNTPLFELNTDMLEFDAPSTRLFLGWQRNVNAMFQLGLDGVSGYFDLHRTDRNLLRFGVLSFFTGASSIVNRAFSLTAHDESHMQAARAIGASSVSLVRDSSGQEMNIWEFFLEAFNFTSEPGLYEYSKVDSTLNEQAYVAGEGLDTNMLTAEATSRKINEGAGYITDLAPYLLNKLWGIGYFLETGPYSDAANYVNLLNEQGYSAVTSRNVISLSAASCLLSGGFLGLMRGTYDFIAEGDSAVKPLGLRIGDVSIYWPELTTWLNPDNVSLLVSVDAAWTDIVFVRAAIDSPVLGNTSVNPELTFGAKAKIHRLCVGMEITSHFAGLPFFLASGEFRLSDTFSLGVEAFYGRGNTMRELREYPGGPGAVGFIKAVL
jgi:hypothetical protein